MRFKLSIEDIDGATLYELFDKLTKIAAEPLIARLSTQPTIKVGQTEIKLPTGSDPLINEAKELCKKAEQLKDLL